MPDLGSPAVGWTTRSLVLCKTSSSGSFWQVLQLLKMGKLSLLNGKIDFNGDNKLVLTQKKSGPALSLPWLLSSILGGTMSCLLTQGFAELCNELDWGKWIQLHPPTHTHLSQLQLNLLHFTIRLGKEKYGERKRIVQGQEQAARSRGNVELLLLSTLTTCAGLKYLSDYNPGIFQIASHFSLCITTP